MMRLKEPFKKKHICTWTKTRDEWDPFSQMRQLERTCRDCNRWQHGWISLGDASEYPPSLIHYADISWRDGPSY